MGPFIVVGIVLAIGSLGLLWWRSEKQRTEQFEQIAQDLGLPYFPKGDSSLQEGLSHFHLFSQGRSRKIRNMMHGESSGVQLAIFDYRYTVGGGNNSRTYKQSVVYFQSPALSLPQFAVRPEGFFHKVGGAFGYQDIDFESHPEFSKTYLLRGENESAIRECFDDDLLTFFETQSKISVEGVGDQLMFYRSGKRIKPGEIQQFMQDGFHVFAQFRGPAEDVV